MNQQTSRGGGRGGNRQSENRQQNNQALMQLQEARLPMPREAAERGIDSTKWTALVEAIFPSAKSVSGVMLAIDYCRARNLDVFKRPVHVVPMWNGKLKREVETVWPGIGELRTTASRTGVWAGNDDIVFGRMLRQSFKDQRSGSGDNGPYVTEASCPEMDFPEWAQMTVYKIVAGVRVPFVGPKVFFIETFSGEKGLRVPNVRWRQAPRGMLEKCAEAAALRRAFPEELAGEMTADEMEGKVVPGGGSTVEGVYHYVDENEANGGEMPQQQTGGGDQQDVGPQWEPDQLAAYMKRMRKAFARFVTIGAIDSALRIEQEAIASLPEQEAAEAQRLEREARDRIEAQQNRGGDERQTGPQDAADQREQQQADDDHHDNEDHHDDDDQAREQQDLGGGGDANEPPFVRNLRRRLSEVELIVDLDNLERVEKRAIDAQPGGVARLCDRIIAEKREQLKG